VGSAVAVTAGALLSGAAVVVGLFSKPDDPWAADQDKIEDALKGWGVNDDLAGTLSEVNDDGQSFGPYIQSAAKAAGVPTLTLLHRMNGWSDDQVNQFLDVARLSHDTDGGNDNRQTNAGMVVGGDLAQQLENGQRTQRTDDQTGLQKYDEQVMREVGSWLENTDGLLHDAPVRTANVFVPVFPTMPGTAAPAP
jgi:hypothetical protein